MLHRIMADWDVYNYWLNGVPELMKQITMETSQVWIYQ